MREIETFVMAAERNTANRRLARGEIVTRADIEGGDRDFDAWRKAGVIVGADTKAAEKAAAKNLMT